jgi:hypothetical protein
MITVDVGEEVVVEAGVGTTTEMNTVQHVAEEDVGGMITVDLQGIHVEGMVAAATVVVVAAATLLEEAVALLHLQHRRYHLEMEALVEEEGRSSAKKSLKTALNQCVKNGWNFRMRTNCFYLWMKFLGHLMLAGSLFKPM